MAGAVKNFTPTPDKIATDAEIVEYLRTSWLTVPDTQGDFSKLPNTYEWNGNITFKFNQNVTVTNANDSGTGDDTTSTLGAISNHEQQRIKDAFAIWDSFIARSITNNQSASSGVIDIGFVTGGTMSSDGSQNGNTSNQAFMDFQGGETASGTNVYGTTKKTIDGNAIRFGRSFSNGELDGRTGGVADGGVGDFAYGVRGFETLLHEIGHSLGLSHPGFYNAGLPAIATGIRFSQDSLENTIMSYRGEDNTGGAYHGVNASTPMVYDILAIQAMYGADRTTRTSNTDSYGFFGNSGAQYQFTAGRGSVFTIWDANGSFDSLDASGYTLAQRIDLTPGSVSDIGDHFGRRMIHNVGIAFGTTIENAVGGSGNDDISGNTANNRLEGRDGNDLLWGDAGGDVLDGNGGNDLVQGGRGNDLLDGGAGNDELWGHEDFNQIFGGAGNDTFHSFVDGTNTVNLGADNDTYYLGAGADTLTDDSGIDTLVFSTAAYADWQFGFFLNDLANDFWNPTQFEKYVGTALNDRIFMSSSFTNNFTLQGGAGADTLTTGRGANDVLQGGLGNDTLNGGIGAADTADFSDHFGSFSGGWNIDLIAGNAFTRSSAAGFILRTETDTLAGIEGVIGSAGNDFIQAREGAIYSNLFLPLSPVYPMIDGGKGTDTLTLSPTITTAIQVIGSPGATANDTVTFSSTGAGTVKTATQVLEGSGLFQIFRPGTGTLQFKNIENLNTGDGNDVINNASGTIVSSLLVPSNIPTIDGGAGTDTLALAANIANVLFIAGRGPANDVVVFSGLGSGSVTTATQIKGTGLLFSQSATSYLNFKGIETLNTGIGNDKVTGSVLKDIVILGDGVDVANMGDGDDSVFGEAGVDTINGGNGKDSIMGGIGADKLTGGAGADTFFYVNTADSTDVITDFAADDFLAFKGTVFGSLTKGAVAAKNFWTNKTGVAHDADDRFIFNTTDDTLWYDSNGNAAGGAFKMADMNIAFNLTAADIVIV
jgi:serralysin